MKKLLVSLLLCTALLLSLGLCARAEARIDYVTDTAGILSEDSRAELSEQAREISERTGFPVYILTVEDYTDYVNNGGIEYFAEQVFHTYDLGVGEKEEGILLALSVRDRDFDLYVHGKFGLYAFTDYGQEQLANSFLDNFRANDWEGGFRDYIVNCGILIERAQNGDPLDIWIPDPPEPVEVKRGIDPIEALLIVLFPGLAAGGVVSGMSRQMKTAVKQSGAYSYVGQGGVELSGREDTFINRSVTRQVLRRQSISDNDRPSGGHYGGTTVSGSHGGSHHSGKF